MPPGHDEIRTRACADPDQKHAPLTIALALTGLEYGGTERQVVMLARGLARRGHRVAVACLLDEGPLAEELRAADIEVYMPGFVRWRDRRVSSIGANVRASLRYARWLRRLRPDVVHSFLVHANLVTIPLATLTRSPVRIAGDRNLGTYRHGRRMLPRVERIVRRLTTHVVTNSEVVATAAVADGTEAESISVIPNGVKTPPHREPGRIVSSDVPVVACVANLRRVKGVDVLLEAAEILERRAVHATYVLVGDGPERQHLESAIARGTADVRLIGSTADPFRWIRAADVVVLPSRSESASNALLEAMAIGRPVVATDVGESASLLGGTGSLVAPENAVQMADAIASLLGDAERRSALGHAAAARARTEYSPEAMVNAHLALYRRLLG